MQTTLSKFQPGKFQYLRTYFYCVIITLTEAVILFFKSCKIYVVLLSVFFFFSQKAGFRESSTRIKIYF